MSACRRPPGVTRVIAYREHGCRYQWCVDAMRVSRCYYRAVAALDRCDGDQPPALVARYRRYRRAALAVEAITVNARVHLAAAGGCRRLPTDYWPARA